MNIFEMAKDWRLEGKLSSKKKYQNSISNGTYTKKNVDGFIADIRGGMDKAKAGRNNNIPKGSVYHLSNVAII